MYSSSEKKLNEKLQISNTTDTKADLIKRLETYEKQNGVEDELDCRIPGLPASNCFKDIDKSTVLPPLSEHHIIEFRQRFKGKPNATLLYECRSLVTLCVAFEGNYAYFHSQCKAHINNLTYKVLLKTDMTGVIEAYYCECADNVLPCKHVYTVLLGIEDMVRTKSIIMHRGTRDFIPFENLKRVYNDPLEEQAVKPNKRNKLEPHQPIRGKQVVDNYEERQCGK